MNLKEIAAESERIETALQNCRAAFTAHPEATWAWCVHHEDEIEHLSEPATARIEYILNFKSEIELVVRFNNFRPVVSELPKELTKAYAAYQTLVVKNQEQRAEYDELWRKAVHGGDMQAKLEYEHHLSEYSASIRARDQAWRLFADIRESFRDELTVLHRKDVPDNTWNPVTGTIFNNLIPALLF